MLDVGVCEKTRFILVVVIITQKCVSFFVQEMEPYLAAVAV